MRFLEYAVVVDFAGSRFVAAGMIGELQVADLLGFESFTEVSAEIAFGDLHVIEIPVDLHVRGVDLIADCD